MRITDFIRTLWTTWRLRFGGAKVGRNLKVLGPLDLLLRDGATLSNVTIGDNVTLGGKVYIRMRRNGCLVLGSGVRTGTDVWLVAANEETLSIGEKTVLGSYSIFNGGHGLKIGAHGIFAAFVYVNTSDHCFARDQLIQNQPFFGKPIEIGNDVWLGGHVFINKGVCVGTGVVIGAGSVVTKDLPDYSIAVGNPARPIRQRE